MARTTRTILIDDIDQSELPEDAGSTVTFGLDGVVYEIDLSIEHAAGLRSKLEGYINAGRRLGRTTGAPSRAATNTRRSDLPQIRTWARENGHDVSDRGRVPLAVINAFDEAHKWSPVRSSLVTDAQSHEKGLTHTVKRRTDEF